MYICRPCLETEFEPILALVHSYGQCEICNQIVECKDIPSKYLTPIKKKQEPKIVATAFIQPDGEFTEKTYDFFTDLELKLNDLVVVRTVHGLSLAVVKYLDRAPGKASNWVVDKVDIEGFLERRMDDEEEDDDAL